MTSSQALMWAGLILTAYLYVGYPLILALLAWLRPRPVRRADARPRMTVIIAAHNEERWIGQKVTNTLSLDYPPERLEVVVASDGSTDRTESIVASCRSPRVRLLRLARLGKANALNEAVAAAEGDVVVFTDANSRVRPDALRNIARNFADPDVGGVCGAKVTLATDGDSTQVGEGLYWRYDQWQKSLETRVGSVFAADGTLYAVRRSLYVPLVELAQADDIAISARVVLQGRRLVFEPEAIAEEPAPGHGVSELRRKIRVTNHSLRALLGLGAPLWTRGLYSFEVISHKLLRHLSPFFLLAVLLGAGGAAISDGFARLVLVAAAGFAALALFGAAVRERSWGSAQLLSFPYYFALVNLAAFLGTISVARGVRVASWSPRGGLERGGCT